MARPISMCLVRPLRKYRKQFNRLYFMLYQLIINDSFPSRKITSRATESFLLTLGIKGPQWLELTNPTIRPEHRSFCTHEFELADAVVGVIKTLPDRAPLPLKMLSLSLAPLTQALSNQTVVAAASVAVYEGVASDHDTDGMARKPKRGCVVSTEKDRKDCHSFLFLYSLMFLLSFTSSGFVPLCLTLFNSNHSSKKNS